MENVSGISLPSPEGPSAITAHPVEAPMLPAPAEPDETPFDDGPIPESPSFIQDQKPTDIDVASVEQKSGSQYKIVTPSKVAYFTEKKEVYVAAWGAKNSKRPLRAFVSSNDGVLFIVGVAQ
jgi:hypothetical protein